tara:strand:+ start:5892 stop:8696 length:2805 start_codon:yes stop_codon:yes gene_type:complete
LHQFINQNQINLDKSTIALCFFILFCALTTAQDFRINGKVVDSLSKEPLEATTVYAESIKDSTLIAYTISNETGFFELDGRTNLKEANLFFSYNGYKTTLRKVELKPSVNLGEITLVEQAEELKGVEVTGERVPIRIKKDTLEFNADSFKTRPDATVEEVLKKLPGVDVDSNGKITVNGKEVSQVLVNGQVFFSKDPKVVTKSLPKEVIDKIQITSTKTKTQEFTGEEGDGDSKTINLTIKEDKNKGVLGRLSGGYGTDERYQANGLLNFFDGQQRISAIASSNNINSAGFSFDEIYGMMGRTRGGISMNSDGGFAVGGLSFGFGEGITTSSNLGASYADSKKGEYKVNANYFYANSDSYNDQKTSRENILPNGRFFTDSESSFEGTTSANQGSANLEFDIDETLRISIEPSMSVNRTNSSNAGSTVSSDETGTVINRNDTYTVGEGKQRNFNNRIDLFKKLDTLGRYVRLSFSNNNRENKDITNFESTREVLGDSPIQEILDQHTMVTDKHDNYTFGVTYREVLADKLFLDFGYEYRNNTDNNKREVFDFDSSVGRYTDFNEALSSDFTFKNRQHNPSLTLSRNGKKLRLGVTASLMNTKLENEDFFRNSSFSKTYNNFLFRASGNYNLNQSKRIYMGYYSRLNLPTINQLQPVANINNPLNVIIGNPNLNPSVSHSVSFDFNNYSWKERTGYFIYAWLSADQEKVVPVTVTDENFLRTTTYTNVKGNQNGQLGTRYSKEFKKDSTLTVKVDFNPYLSYRKDVGFNNGNKLEARIWSVTPRITTTLNFKELLEIVPGYRIGFNDTKYNIDTFEDVNFISHTAEFKTTTYWPKGLVWGNDISYTYNGNVGPSFDRDFLLWNMSLGVQMFKDKGTFKILAYDLLDQNNNTRRSTGQDFVQDFQGTVLQRYFMASFTFKFDQFGGKKSNGNGIRFF